MKSVLQWWHTWLASETLMCHTVQKGDSDWRWSACWEIQQDKWGGDWEYQGAPKMPRFRVDRPCHLVGVERYVPQTRCISVQLTLHQGGCGLVDIADVEDVPDVPCQTQRVKVQSYPRKISAWCIHHLFVGGHGIGTTFFVWRGWKSSRDSRRL